MDVTVYEFPPELEPYRALIGGTDDLRIEDIMNRFLNNFDLDFSEVLRASSVQAQISLLKTLYRARMLRDLSAWFCKSPYGENFCGGPTEHPDFWGCGYQKVD